MVGCFTLMHVMKKLIFKKINFILIQPKIMEEYFILLIQNFFLYFKMNLFIILQILVGALLLLNKI